MSQKHPFNLVIVTVMLLIVSAVSMSYLHADSLYFDERITVIHLGDLTHQHNLIETAQSIAETSQQHSPGYFWLLNIWGRFSGYSQVGLRYFSVLIGLISLAVFYRLVVQWYDRWVAIIALGLLSASALNIYYFHEMRMYTLISLLMFLLIWQYSRIIREDYLPTRRDWFALFLVVTSLIYTHYFALFPLAGIAVYHLLFVRKDKRWLILSAVMIVAGLTFLPWLSVVIDGTSEVMEESRDVLSTPATLQVLWWLFSNGWVVLMLASIGGLLVALRHFRTILFPLVMTVVILLGLLAANIVMELLPVRRSRYFLLVIPFIAIVVAYGLARMPYARVIAPVLIALWFVSGIRLHYSSNFDLYTNRALFQQDDLPPFSEMIRAFFRTGVARTPDDLLLMVTNLTPTGQISDDPFYASYYQARLNVIGMVIEPMTFSADDEHPFYHDSADYQLSINPPVVYVALDPNKTVEDYQQDIQNRILGGDYTACDPLEESPDFRLDVYVHSPAPCSMIEASNIRMTFREEALELQHVAMNELDNQLVVATRWAMMGEMPLDAYSYSLRAIDSDGNLIDQVDSGIPLGLSSFGTPNGTNRHALAVFDTEAWQAGDYQIQVVVYNWQTGERLHGRLNGTVSADGLTVASYEHP